VGWVPHSATATTRAWGNAERSPLFTPGRPNHSALSGVSAVSTQVPSMATNRRPASHADGVDSAAIGTATCLNSSQRGSEPNRTRAWKIADFDGNLGGSPPGSAHDRPSVNNDNTSKYDPSECNAIPIEKYAITRAGNNRCRCSLRPTPQ